MILRYCVFCLVVFWVSMLSSSTQATVIKIAIHQQDLEDYHQLMSNQNCDEISDYSIFKMQQSGLYFTLICQALLRSQFTATFQAVPTPNYRRSIWQVAQGLVDISANTYMANQYISPMLEAGTVSFSVPIIRRGEQVAAFYALPSNTTAMSVTNLEKLKKLKVVIPSSWRIYTDIFRELGIKAERLHTCETSGLGAAINAAVGAGFYSDYKQAVEAMVHRGQVFTPVAENKAIYNQLFNDVYQKMYSRLNPIYRSIRNITGYPCMPSSS